MKALVLQQTDENRLWHSTINYRNASSRRYYSRYLLVYT